MPTRSGRHGMRREPFGRLTAHDRIGASTPKVPSRMNHNPRVEQSQSSLRITRLYKYLAPKWADAMIQCGSMRIGTLNEYRAMEARDAERGDVGEGTRTLHSDERPRVYNSTTELPPVLRGIACGPGGLATNGPNAIVIENRVPDLYVYCVTEVFDAAVMNAFGGACVSIESPAAFFASVDREFRNKLSTLGLSVRDGVLGGCVYASRHQNFHAAVPVHDCFLKPPAYRHQREFRAVWQPATLPISAIALECKAATSKYCRRQE